MERINLYNNITPKNASITSLISKIVRGKLWYFIYSNKKMKKQTLLIFILIIASNTFAQVKFTAASEKVVQTGETFRLVYTVNAQTSGFEKPRITGFDVLSGPNKSTSRSFEYINGKSTQSYSFSYTYYLRARKEGTFKIPAAKVTVNGKAYKSNSLNIKVVKESHSNTGKNNKNKNGNREDLFLRVFIDKGKVTKGEPIVATVKLYSLIDLVDIENLEFPKYSGFMIKNMFTPDRINLERETYKGKIYNTAILRRDLLFPQRTGKLNIQKAKIDLIVRQKTGRVRNFFGQWVNRYENIRRTVISPTVTVTVSPLPGNKPDNFSALVGKNFTIQTKIDKTDIKTNEGTNLRISISGTGNINLLNEIDINIPKDIESFPEVSDRIQYTAAGATGTKHFDYLLVPEAPGKFRIPPVSIVYFDTQSKSYITIKSDEIILNVEKSKDYVENNYNTHNSKIAEQIDNDIRFLKRNNVNLTKEKKQFAGSNIHFILYALILALFATIIILKRQQIKDRSNVAEYKNRKAGKISRRRLKTAKILLKQDNKNEFYKEISKALWSYTTNKFRIAASSLTKDKISDELNKQKVDTDLINELLNILNEAEYAQYGGSASNGGAENLYGKAAQIIKKLEQSC